MSEQRFEQVFQGSPVAMSLSRISDRTVVEVNDAYLRTFGVTREQIIGQCPDDAGVVCDSFERGDALAKVVRDGSLQECEVTIRSPAGRKQMMLWSRLLDVDGVAYAMTTFLDVGVYRGTVSADDRFRELAESMDEVFWLTDRINQTMLYISPAYEKIWGRTRAALYADARDWMASVHPEDRQRMEAFLVKLAVTTERMVETYRIVRPDGTTRTIRIAVFPVIELDGTSTRVAGSGRDITEQLALEDQVREGQKLESIGLLAGGVAHDFNNILAVIATSASMLGEVVTNESDRELVTEIDEAVRRAVGLTRQLLAFSRKQIVEPIVLDLNRTVSETHKMLRRMVGEDIVIETSFEPDLGHVRIDPGYLVQVLMNLAVNARDAMPRGGTLAITTRNLAEPRRIQLTVTDTGMGMSPEVRAHVFEPFFTTKAVGRGTGLGLSVVHGIIQQAGGEIEIESEVGMGTAFRITLPCVDAPVDALDDLAAVASRGTERIIVVDDDLFVRRATSRALRSHGFDVLEAGDGRTALRLLRDPEIALLVTDVVMPGMDGCELVKLARQRRPSLNVVYMSGHTDDVLAHHRVDATVLEKPFAGHVLAGRVRQAIDAHKH